MNKFSGALREPKAQEVDPTFAVPVHIYSDSRGNYRPRIAPVGERVETDGPVRVLRRDGRPVWQAGGAA